MVGEMGGQGRQEQLALGESPSAARLQGLATPNTVVVSHATHRLIEGYFTWEALGEQTLRGVSQPLNVYQVLGESGNYSRLDVAQIEDSHRWLVASKKSVSSWNGGSKPNLGKDR